MKNKKILSLILAIVLVVTQFSLLCISTSAATYSALTGRDNFVKGVNIHNPINSVAYKDSYQALLDAKSLGVNMVRIDYALNFDNDYYQWYKILSLAEDLNIDVMLVVGIYDQFLTKEVEGEKVQISNVSDLDTTKISSYFNNIATKFNGKVAYYQIGNEMDNQYIKFGEDGSSTNDYNVDFDVVKTALATAYNAIDTVDSNAKTVMNFGYMHYGFLQGLKEKGLDWDVTGINWYANMEKEGYLGTSWGAKNHSDVINAVSTLGKDVIFTECGPWPTSATETIGGADWLATFCKDVYENTNYQDKVIGVIPYELYDQPVFQPEDGTFNKEAYFGLINSDGIRKDTFTALQQLYGGVDVTDPIAQVPARASSIGSIAAESTTDVVTKTVVGDSYSTFKIDGTLPEATNAYVRPSDNNDLENKEHGTTVMNQRFYNYMEFDLYVEDYLALKNSLNDNKTLMLNLSYSTNFGIGSNAYQWINLEDQITKNGWNHIVLYLGKVSENSKGYTKSKSAGWTQQNRYYSIFVGEPESTTFAENYTVGAVSSATTIGATENDLIALGNVFLSSFVAPEPQSTVGTIATESLTTTVTQKTVGANYNTFQIVGVLPAEVTKTVDGVEKGIMGSGAYGYLEFDLYIENYAAFKSSLGTENALMLQLDQGTTASKNNPGGLGFQWFSLDTQIKNDGWNHIVLKLNDYKATNNSSTGSVNNRRYQLFVGKNTGTFQNGWDNSNISTESTTNGDLIALANVFLSNLTSPEKKSIVGTIFEESVDNKVTTATIGSTYSMQLNGTLPSATYQANLVKPIVHRKIYDYIEFDVYIEDYDTFINSLSYDANGTKLTNKNSLMFNLSKSTTWLLGTNAYQWWGLEEQITKSGWNHIILNLWNDALFSTLNANSKNASAGWGQDNRYYSLFVGQTDGTTNTNDHTPVKASSTTTTKTNGDTIAIANVLLSKVAKPTADYSEYGLVKYLHDGFSEMTLNGNSLADAVITDSYKVGDNSKTYTLINNQTPALLQTLTEAIDCSAADYIQMDFFSEAPELLRKTLKDQGMAWNFYLYDSNNNTAVINFEDKLNAGWTHLTLAKTDFDVKSGFDWSAITSYRMIFNGVTGLTTQTFYERHQEFGITNLAAVDKYTDVLGDANNDGICDVRDLVRAKKVITGQNAFINIPMMTFDLEGDIKAENLVYLRKLLLGISF